MVRPRVSLSKYFENDIFKYTYHVVCKDGLRLANASAIGYTLTPQINTTLILL